MVERYRSGFYSRDTITVARELLGGRLCRVREDTLLKGRIVETEAYLGPGDPASHASAGRTKRSSIMWDEPGLSYVYLIYGCHYLFNVVSESKGSPGAILIRAVEPLGGISVMEKGRSVDTRAELTDGPGKLTQAFFIGRDEHGLDLTTCRSLWIAEGDLADGENIVSSSRIGISGGRDKPYRFFVEESDYISG